MAAKRKQKRTKTPETMGPSQWRLQHGDFTPPIREADPETGRPVQHRRAVDTLGMMLANGTITQEMHDAGSTFRALFYVAALDGVTRSALVRNGPCARAGADGLSRRHKRRGCWWRRSAYSRGILGWWVGRGRRKTDLYLTKVSHLG